MASIALPVTDPTAARPTVAQALEGQGFTVTWTDDWTAEAVIGSKAGVALAGGFKPHIRLQASFTAAEQGAWVQVAQTTTGATGGALGLSKTKKKWRATVDALTGDLQSAGLLSGAPQES